MKENVGRVFPLFFFVNGIVLFYISAYYKVLFLFSNYFVYLDPSTDVYDRLSKKGRKPGLSELLLTQIVSAVWHVSLA